MFRKKQQQLKCSFFSCCGWSVTTRTKRIPLVPYIHTYVHLYIDSVHSTHIQLVDTVGFNEPKRNTAKIESYNIGLYYFVNNVFNLFIFIMKPLAQVHIYRSTLVYINAINLGTKGEMTLKK